MRHFLLPVLTVAILACPLTPTPLPEGAREARSRAPHAIAAVGAAVAGAAADRQGAAVVAGRRPALELLFPEAEIEPVTCALAIRGTAERLHRSFAALSATRQASPW